VKKILLGALVALSIAAAAHAEPTMTRAAKKSPKVAIALGYLDGVWNQHKPVETFAKFVAPDEIHYPGKPGGHNPNGLAKFLEGYPNFKYEFKHVYVDGDYVIVHSLITGCPGIGTMVNSSQPGVEPKPKVGDEVVDIFHIRNGKIVEQWDTVEPIGGTAEGIY